MVTFNNSNGLSEEELQKELVPTLNVKTNGTFLGDDLQLSMNTNPNQTGNNLKFRGKFDIKVKCSNFFEIT